MVVLVDMKADGEKEEEDKHRQWRGDLKLKL